MPLNFFNDLIFPDGVLQILYGMKYFTQKLNENLLKARFCWGNFLIGCDINEGVENENCR
jgi:hypothetical protein